MRAFLAALVASLAFACGGDGGGFDWRIRFETPELARFAVGVDADILPGGCASTSSPVYSASLNRGETGMRPPELEPGTYGFRARARNLDCEAYAAGCVDVTFEAGEKPETVVTILAEVPATALCAAAECSDGNCSSFSDAGGGCVPECSGDDLIDCDGDGNPVTVSCDFGCGGTPAACLDVTASNVGDAVAFDEGTGDVDLATDDTRPLWLWNSDTGEIQSLTAPDDDAPMTVRPAGEGMDMATGIAFRPVPGGGDPAPDLGVFVMASLTIPEATTLAASGSRAFVLVVNGDVSVAGTLSVAARRALPWDPAGGFAGGVASMAEMPSPGGSGPGAGGGGPDTTIDPGGGGGGFGSMGGLGGGPMGGAAGVAYGTAELVPLIGGSGGGTGGHRATGGGHGGGALQVVSRSSIAVLATGVIDACGEGGDRGTGTDTTGGGGGGAGSGGAVLLEAPVVTLEGVVAANGGSGGQGGVNLPEVAAHGRDGSPTDVPAAGRPAPNASGAGSDADGSAGGAGGADTDGGGGGGGAGRIRINTLAGTDTYPTTTPNEASGLTTVGTLTLE